MGSKKGTSTTVMKNLPSYADSSVLGFLNRAVTLSNEAYQLYTGPTYAGQNADEVDAVSRLATRGRNGNTTVSKGATHLEAVLDGGYLAGTHAGFTSLQIKALGKPSASFTASVAPKLGASAYIMGNPLSENIAEDLAVNTVSRYANRSSAMLFLKNREFERNMQNHSLEHGITYAGESAKDAEYLRLAGLYAREYSQGSYEDLYKTWYEQQVANVRRLEILGNAIRSLVGTQEADSEQYARMSPWVGAAGGAMAGGAAGGAIAGAAWGQGAGPYGVVVGAVIGGAIGYFSSR